MSIVLQVLDIFEICISHIFEFCWLKKVTSTFSKRLTDIDGGGDNNKFYVNIIDHLYVILNARRKLDGFKW